MDTEKFYNLLLFSFFVFFFKLSWQKNNLNLLLGFDIKSFHIVDHWYDIWNFIDIVFKYHPCLSFHWIWTLDIFVIWLLTLKCYEHLYSSHNFQNMCLDSNHITDDTLNLSRNSQYLKVWVFIESLKGLAIKDSLIITKKKKTIFELFDCIRKNIFFITYYFNLLLNCFYYCLLP